MVLVSQVVTTGGVSMIHFSSGPSVTWKSHTLCWYSYLCDTDANDQTGRKKIKIRIETGIHSSWDIVSVTFHRTLYSTVPIPALIRTFCYSSDQTRRKNTILVHFIHSVSFTCTWVPTYCTSVKDMKKRARRWQGGDMTEGLVVKYSSKFIPTSDPPLGLLPTPPSHNDIWVNWYTVCTGWF